MFELFYEFPSHLSSDGSPEEVWPPEEEGLRDGGVEAHVEREEPQPDLTSGVRAAFHTFKTQLEQHLMVSTTMVNMWLLVVVVDIIWLINKFYSQ